MIEVGMGVKIMEDLLNFKVMDGNFIEMKFNFINNLTKLIRIFDYFNGDYIGWYFDGFELNYLR